MTDYCFINSNSDEEDTCIDNAGIQVNIENDENSEIFKGYDLCDFRQNVIIGNFKLPHSNAADCFNFLVDKTRGKVLVTLENGSEKEPNEHIHFAIAESGITPDTLKKYIRTRWPQLVKSTFGGEKRYYAKYAKELLYQVIYLFKENTSRDTWMTNIPEILEDPVFTKEDHYNAYHNMYNKQKQTFSKSPAGQFYEYFVKGGYLQTINLESCTIGFNTHLYSDLRDQIAYVACDYALLKDNPNPGIQYIIKLVNYVHLKVHPDSFKAYIKDQLHRQY